VQQGVGVKADYRRAVREYYDSQIMTVDFGASGSGRVVAAVNSWAATATDGRVEELLEREPGSGARVLVGGAAALQPTWLHPFDPEQTSYSGQFWLPDGETRWGQCSAVQCSAVQCSAVQCSAVQCSAV
jgi:serine protease inhibitor